MTTDEWEAMSLLIEEGWPGEFTDDAEKAWRVFLDDYDAGQVLQALKRLLARGGRFRPSVAEVVAELRADPSQPTVSEACGPAGLIYGRRGVLRARPEARTFADEAERGQLYRAAQRARAREMHPMVFTFCERVGYDWLAGLEVDHPDYGPLRRKELEAKWHEHVEAMEGRDVAAIGAGPRRGELGRFDPLAALGRPGPDRPRLKRSAA